MLYAGLDLSRQRLDVHLLDEDGRTVEVTAVRPDADALRTLVARVARHGQPVTAAIESMNGARFVHDQLELAGWDVEIADALKVKGLAPAGRQDRQDRCLGPRRARPAGPRARDLAARPGDPGRARAGPLPAPPRPPPDGAEEPDPRHAHRLRSPGPGDRPVRGRGPGAARRASRSPSPGRRPWPRASRFVDELDREIDACEARAAARWAPTTRTSRCCVTVPGIAWVLGYTIASEIGDIGRFSSAQEARRVHRAVSVRPPVGRPGRPRAARQERAQVPALGAHRGRHPRRPAPGLPRALRADQAAPRSPARRQGRPGRHRPRARHRHLAHAHARTNRSLPAGPP